MLESVKACKCVPPSVMLVSVRQALVDRARFFLPCFSGLGLGVGEAETGAQLPA